MVCCGPAGCFLRSSEVALIERVVKQTISVPAEAGTITSVNL